MFVTGLVLAAGDVRRLSREAAGTPIGVCRYADGLGHPFWFRSEV